ncbi:MAG: replication initiation factor domain-containing protein [Rhodobacterales bacterium]|nr:replication initiation factor domain-containing protein [Rhodobacterales bacterium]
MLYPFNIIPQSVVLRAPLDMSGAADGGAMAIESLWQRGGLSDRAQSAMRAARDVSQRGPAGEAEGPVDPRLVTRGSFPSKPLKPKAKRGGAAATDLALAALLDQAFFDWFQITLPNQEGRAQCQVGGAEEGDAIGAAFGWAVHNGLHPGRISGGHNGYRAALPFTMGPESSEAVFRVNSGSTGGLMPNLMLTGGHGACATLAPLLQAQFQGARLSRADAAIDWSQAGLFDELLSMARLLARANVKLGGVRLIESDTGRTFYLGSRTSTVSLRVYEKDRERAARGVIDVDDVDPDLIRIEWTFRPQSKSKAGMAGLSPGEMIRTSIWARDFMARAAMLMQVTDRVGRLDPQAVVREVREKTLEGTVQHGVDQYAKSFARLAAARLVEREHDGRYDMAMVDYSEIESEATAIFISLLKETEAAKAIVIEQRLGEVMDPDAWRASYVHELMQEPVWQDRSRDKARSSMMDRARAMGMEVRA